ncbi:MAG: response regulator [Desulforegulaceae bacterium]|nr:response regulator [Desulforegulaceae bacterium]
MKKSLFYTLRSKLSRGFYLMGEILYKREDETRVEDKIENESLLQLTRLKTEYFLNISREIRVPLNEIIGTTGLLLDTKISDQQKEYGKTIKSRADSILAIIDDLMDFQRIESEKLQPEIVDFNLYSVVEETLALLGFKSESKNIELVYLSESDLPVFLQGKPEKLRQILLILLENSIKLAKKGEVSLRVEKVSQTKNKVRLKFRIKGSGSKIDNQKNQDQLDHNFSICEKIAEIMGGEFGLETSEFVGTNYWFTAVFGFGQGKNSFLSEIVSESVSSNPRILLVEDNELNRKHLEILLKSWGFDCESAENEKMGMEKFLDSLKSGNPFQLGILDFRMPWMNGEKLLSALRADGRFDDFKIIFMSFPKDRKYFFNLDKKSIAFLPKPVKQGQLYNCILNFSRDNSKEFYLQEPESPLKLSNMLESFAGKQNIDSDKINDLNSEENKDKKMLFDFESLLSKLMGDEKAGKELINIFTDNLQKLVNELEKEINNSDFLRIDQLSHSIKGSAANIGAQKLAEKAGIIEELINSLDLDSIKIAFGDLKKCKKDTQTEISKVIES